MSTARARPVPPASAPKVAPAPTSPSVTRASRAGLARQSECDRAMKETVFVTDNEHTFRICVPQDEPHLPRVRGNVEHKIGGVRFAGNESSLQTIDGARIAVAFRVHQSHVTTIRRQG